MSRILVVDDQRDVAETTCRLARHMGHIAESLTSPALFAKIFLRFRPDVIVLDHHMPGDGDEIFHWLEDVDYSGRIVLVSGEHSLPEGAVYPSKPGIRMSIISLHKPFQYSDLERAMQAAT
jgi:FixJ family two-component response regulator